MSRPSVGAYAWQQQPSLLRRVIKTVLTNTTGRSCAAAPRRENAFDTHRTRLCLCDGCAHRGAGEGVGRQPAGKLVAVGGDVNVVEQPSWLPADVVRPWPVVHDSTLEPLTLSYIVAADSKAHADVTAFQFSP